jgi:hypothetical protein
VQHRRHQQPDRLIEIDQPPQVRVAQHRVRVAHVGGDDRGRPVMGEQLAGVGTDHRVNVHVDDVRIRRDPLHDPVRVALRGQARADVHELAQAPLGSHPAGRPLMERPVHPRRVLQIGRPLPDSLRGFTVDREVVLAAQHVVVHPGGAGLGGVDTRRDLRGFGHNAP